LLVRKGSYSGFQTTKAVRVLGEAEVNVSGGAMISGIPAGRDFVIKSVAFAGLAYGLRITSSAGSIVLEDVEAKVTTNLPPLTWGMIVEASAKVALNRCRCSGGTLVTGSTMTTTSSVFTGSDPNPLFYPQPGTPALLTSSSTLVLGDCQATGGNGLVRASGGIAPASAVDSTKCSLVVLGDRSVLSAGRTGDPSDVPAIRGAGGNLLLDPVAVLVPFGSGNKYAGFDKTHERRLPSLTATGAGPGETVRSDLYSTRGHTVLLFAGFPINPLVVPGIGQFWLDPVTMLLLDAGVQGSLEHRLTNIPVPNSAVLRGVPLVLQALSGVFPGLETSSAVHVVLH